MPPCRSGTSVLSSLAGGGGGGHAAIHDKGAVKETTSLSRPVVTGVSSTHMSSPHSCRYSFFLCW